VKIFSGTANPSLAKEISNACSLDISKIEIHTFPDGEKRIRILEDVLGEHVIVVQPTAPPVEENYFELFFLADALKRSGAKFVTAVVPYLGYQRQDHIFQDGEAVSLEVVIKTLERIGVDRFILCDLHSIKTPEVFSIPVQHISALSVFAKKITEIQKADATILISPDMGGIRRIKILSELLGHMPYAAIEKQRDLQSGFVTATNFGEGTITNQTCAIIVDDMISSGKTVVAACKVLQERGINEIYVFATHAIFSEDAPHILERSSVKKVFVSNSVFVPKHKHFLKLEILSIAAIIAKEIQA